MKVRRFGPNVWPFVSVYNREAKENWHIYTYLTQTCDETAQKHLKPNRCTLLYAKHHKYAIHDANSGMGGYPSASWCIIPPVPFSPSSCLCNRSLMPCPAWCCAQNCMHAWQQLNGQSCVGCVPLMLLNSHLQVTHCFSYIPCVTIRKRDTSNYPCPTRWSYLIF